ncbi:ketopantoate reductase family protein [Jeotgalibacillus soli]|uniref:2-dehydropantoate 2-reductase n=1 Tax=Jeotgalibacillus soli TaxID=889306 RepID=A0A0C2RP95_9BACL|nr:ketopantoate reductase family protein [Jeotgalibacillus soli]KIL52065.1 2-dehydropantoate 2-reductase [Jeotgalibacillus soli]
MKILVVGAGAIGGYFGGRLLEKGENVTFLVREKRKKQLEQTGLMIKSVHGNMHLTPSLITADQRADPFDVILISTKSYQLNDVIKDIHPFVGNETMILPLLNGIAHVNQLIKEFGEKAVIGGLCFIETTLDHEGRVIQSSPIHKLVYGERNGQMTDRIKRLQSSFEGTKASFILSEKINQDMWHKYLFISAFSGITSLMNSPIGPIREEKSGYKAIAVLLNEISAIMKKIEAPIEEKIAEAQLETMKEMGDQMKSSMQRDMEKLFPIEAEHLHGYLLEKAEDHHLDAPVLQTIYTKLKLYEKELSQNQP